MKTTFYKAVSWLFKTCSRSTQHLSCPINFTSKPAAAAEQWIQLESGPNQSWMRDSDPAAVNNTAETKRFEDEPQGIWERTVQIGKFNSAQMKLTLVELAPIIVNTAIVGCAFIAHLWRCGGWCATNAHTTDVTRKFAVVKDNLIPSLVVWPTIPANKLVP
jgi:hypothetical protein